MFGQAAGVAKAPDEAAVVAALAEARRRTHALVASVSDQDLERVHSPLMSPLVWDLGHIAAFEDLWIAHRLGGRPMLRADMAEVYDAFETPRAGRGDLPLLGPADAIAFLAAVRERSLEVIDERGLGEGVVEMVLRHEHQHTETMLQTLQLARLSDYRLPREPRAARHPGDPRGGDAAPVGAGGLELVEVPGGPCTLGAGPAGFAYDNERPRHQTDVRGYLIGRVPITNASYLTFVEGGGYERREWWSDEGWSWKEDYDITRPEGWTPDLASEWRLDRLQPLHPDRPVIHISWFEADAFARAHGMRLPSEAEWEKAATWDQEQQRARSHPWGETPAVTGVHANLDQLTGGTVPSGTLTAGASPYGCLAMIGDIWEWTSSVFAGYPGFSAFPYPEYSEVFFGDGYRVLRGGSWATRPAVATATFRNWDLPQRRQIFSGLRVARDL
ncbi:MAG TPA: ergothioneine biosynthesis protein EgtB [Solirubrobacteraceae bacterium]|nr:ergothioneine biosynthesis protein EgtB [Solirubrobacteraceae bacterium]